MNTPIDESAQLDVEISNLYATDAELSKFSELVARGLGSTATAMNIQAMGSSAKGIRYVVKFTVLKPKHFSLDVVRDWLHSATLVGWEINATIVDPQRP